MEFDKSQLPASIIQAASLDPAIGTSAPPNFGQEVVPHIYTASGRYGIASQSYLNMDEALRDSRQNAERMRSDCGIMECIEQRQRAVALLPWHIEPDDPKDQRQKDLATAMTAIIEKTPRFTEMRRNALEAIWFGRSGIANSFGSKLVRGQWRTVVKKWEPRHGDKIVFRYDDGSKDVDPDQIGIRVSTNFRNSYTKSMIGHGIQSKIQPTEMGLVYWLDRWERQTMIVHKHMVEDGPYEDPRMAGRIHGIGIRDRIYWTWYAMVECLQRVVEYLDRAAFGVEVWPYQQGNAKSKEATEQAAFGSMGGGRTVILAPIPPGPDDPDRYMPHLIEPGLGGVSATMEIIRTYFGHKIKRYILGQTLSSEAESTGMGSGVSDAHLATLSDILSYDARNLEETLTTDFLRPLQYWNFRDSYDCDLKFVIDTESDNVKEHLTAIKLCWDMGLKIKADELNGIVGLAKPDDDDEILQNPAMAQAAMMAAQGGAIQQGTNGGMIISPETFHESFLKHMAGNKWAA
jgi:hypothetical protein